MSLSGLSGLSSLSGLVAIGSGQAGLPTDNLFAHWDAAVGVTHVSNSVTHWAAATESGTNTTLEDIGSTGDPIYDASDAVFGGLPSIMTGDQRYFFINKEAGLNTATGFCVSVMYGTDESDAGAFINFAKASFTSSYFYQWNNVAGGLISRRYRFLSPSVDRTITQGAGNPWTNSVPYVWVLGDNGSEVIVRRNGVEVVNTTTPDAYLQNIDDGGGLRISVGSDVGGTSTPIFWGDLAIYKAYDVSIIEQAESFFASKYGIALG